MNLAYRSSHSQFSLFRFGCAVSRKRGVEREGTRFFNTRRSLSWVNCFFFFSQLSTTVKCLPFALGGLCSLFEGRRVDRSTRSPSAQYVTWRFVEYVVFRGEQGERLVVLNEKHSFSNLHSAPSVHNTWDTTDHLQIICAHFTI